MIVVSDGQQCPHYDARLILEEILLSSYIPQALISIYCYVEGNKVTLLVTVFLWKLIVI